MEKSSIQTRIFLFFKNERSWVCKQVCMSSRLFWVNLKVSTRANQKVLTQSEVPLFPFFFFFGKTKSKHKPLWWSGWRALKTMQIRERKDVSVETGVGRGGILRGGRKKKNTTESKHLWASALCCPRPRHHSRGRFSLCFFVNSSAFFMNLARSLQYSSARSALRGCSGSGQVTRVISAFRTFDQSANQILKNVLIYLANSIVSQQWPVSTLSL